MKFNDSFGPNPTTVKIFIADRKHKFGIEAHAVDIMSMENRDEKYPLEVNARGEIPALMTCNTF